MAIRKTAIISIVSFISVITFGTVTAGKVPEEWSPTQPYPEHDVYYPGTEALSPDEMRVIACGTGMPTLQFTNASSRPK